MIIAESIGFAGTHSISSILAGIDGIECAHGSQNFKLKNGIGPDSVDPKEFLTQMKDTENEQGTTAVAVHCLYHPLETKPICRARKAKYFGIVRDPLRQVESCYAWACKKVMSGDQNSARIVSQNIAKLSNERWVRHSLPNALYLFAIEHVLGFNALLLNSGAPLYRMEDLLNKKEVFVEAFELSDDLEISHFDGGETTHQASHKKQREAELVADPDRDHLRTMFSYRNTGGRLNWEEFRKALGYE